MRYFLHCPYCQVRCLEYLKDHPPIEGETMEASDWKEVSRGEHPINGTKVLCHKCGKGLICTSEFMETVEDA